MEKPELELELERFLRLKIYRDKGEIRYFLALRLLIFLLQLFKGEVGRGLCS